MHFKKCNVLKCAVLIGASVQMTGCQSYAGDSSDDAVISTEAIVGGNVENGHPEVGLLYASSSACTATLVHECGALTAAHCARDGEKVTLQVGGTVYRGKLSRGPEYNGKFPDAGDIAFVELDRRVAGVKPANLTFAAPKVGDSLRVVGFGLTGASDSQSFGTKRSAANKVSGLPGDLVEFRRESGGVVCFGDSGGPTFLEGTSTQVGVNAWTSGCISAGWSTRVDQYASWLKSKIASLNCGSTGGSSGGSAVAPETQQPTPPPTADGGGVTPRSGTSDALVDCNGDGVAGEPAGCVCRNDASSCSQYGPQKNGFGFVQFEGVERSPTDGSCREGRLVSQSWRYTASGKVANPNFKTCADLPLCSSVNNLGC